MTRTRCHSPDASAARRQRGDPARAGTRSRRSGSGELRGAPADGVVTRGPRRLARRRPGDLFVALNTGVGSSTTRSRGARRRSSRTTRRRRSRRSRALVRERSDAQVVAVVGSTGKTTTKDALGALCAAVTPTVAADASQQQRARPAADRAPARARDARARHRDGHARARADRGALRDRPADARARHLDRARSTSSSSARSRTSPARTPRRSRRCRPAASRSSPPTSR